MSRRTTERRSLRRARCGLFATASDFLHRRHYQLWTSVSNKVDTFTAAGWRKPVWRLAEAKRPSLRICSRKWISRSDARGSLLACMTANREPSNQSFEVDREATVCLRAVASFCDDRYPARHGQRATGSLALLRETAQSRAAPFFPLLREFARGGKPSIVLVLASSCQNSPLAANRSFT